MPLGETRKTDKQQTPEGHLVHSNSPVNSLAQISIRKCHIRGSLTFFFLYFFLKWGYFFFLWVTFFLLSTKIKVVHTQGGTQNTNRHTPPIRFKSGGEDESPAHLPLGTLLTFSGFRKTGKGSKRQQKTGKGARKNTREKKPGAHGEARGRRGEARSRRGRPVRSI